jgi:hypothetical protein
MARHSISAFCSAIAPLRRGRLLDLRATDPFTLCIVGRRAASGSSAPRTRNQDDALAAIWAGVKSPPV